MKIITINKQHLTNNISAQVRLKFNWITCTVVSLSDLLLRNVENVKSWKE